MTRTPSLTEVVSKAIEHRLSSLHVCMPARVESYDHVTQTCSAQPLIKNVIASDDGEESLTFPVITNVPVAHPRAGGWFVHLPLATGDHVMLHFAERAIDFFRLLGGVQDPLDVRKHDLSDAIAVPCNLYPDAGALIGLAQDTLSLGNALSTIQIKPDGSVNLGSNTPLDAVATALKVNAQLQALAAVFAAWVPVPGDGGAVLKTALGVLALTGWPADVASAKVKVDP